MEIKSTSKCFVSHNFDPNGYVFENRLVALMFPFLTLLYFDFSNPSNTISFPDNDVSNRFRASQPRLRSRPKWSMIRPSQMKVTFDQTDPDWFFLWSDNNALKAPCALNVRSKTYSLWSDYCALECHPLIRLVCARKRLWSDCCAFESASGQNGGHSKTPLIILKCARNCLWSGRSALRIIYDQTAVRSKLPLTRPKCVRPVENKLTSKCFVSHTFEPNEYVFENRLVALMFLFLILYCFYFWNPSSTISIPDNEFSNTFRARQPKLRSRPKWSLIRPSQAKLTSDQTNPDWVFLWSDYSALKAPCALIVRSKTSSDQTIVHSNGTPWSD